LGFSKPAAQIAQCWIQIKCGLSLIVNQQSH
jgi:hypothetical protein